ncbi:GNAT family N-acetyltransferase [Kosakonia sp. CFBP8986]|uniref:GNAT family N-acetyltransferase n=1 Tax=Kosakonia sp. CFBP8986 TaxID=3096524 RepID=UPI002A6B338D|nr:GNAT family N-acetyltransferase [Kosakonia sp. CFBP8986]MDY0890187.1 GNAT family N-acetyltransferase [Kosakonia sp. CFBP8986]
MISIRAAELKDIPSLKRLFLQLGYETEHAILEQCLRDQHDTLCTLVAESEKEVCGVIVINFIMPVHENNLWALISALVIDESLRGQGVGQQLLIASERIAAIKRCSQIELSSNETRVKAHKFYENNGYKEVRKRFVKLLTDLPPLD